LRPWLYRCYGLLLRKHAAGIFTISQLALAQYHYAGVPSAKLFPFGYFIPNDIAVPMSSISLEPCANVGLRIIFVGNLIRTKGVDLLQAAVQNLASQGCKVSVDIYGHGDASSIPANDGNVHYRGTIPFGQAQKVIAQYDLLVLPSRYDGWGVVVNEALCAGVPVVCSDTTGAGPVAASLGAGLNFTTGDSNSLSDVLARLLTEPALLKSMRTAVPQAAHALQPAVAARYMLDVIRAPVDLRATIRSPWYPDHA
jgi:glycosyltransferase involved in cell wall biosynthesis